MIKFLSAFTATVLCTFALCATPETLESPLLDKTTLLSTYLKHAFGETNPFRDRCTTIYLTAEMRKLLAKDEDETAAKHHEVLTSLLDRMDHIVDNALLALSNKASNTEQLKALTQVTNEAEFYINAHLGNLLSQCTHTQRFAQKNNRILGSVIGISLVSGTVKYILLGVAGAAILGTVYSVLKYLTKEVDETAKDIKNNEQGLRTEIENYCTAAHNLVHPDQARGYRDTPLPMRTGGNFLRRLLLNPFVNLGRKIRNGFRGRNLKRSYNIQSSYQSVCELGRYLDARYPGNSALLAQAQEEFRRWSELTR